MAEVLQADPALVGNAVLASAALAVQAHANVEVDGLTVPLSIFALSVAESGERKSATDGLASAPHEEWQRKLLGEYRNLYHAYQDALELHKKAKAAVIADKKGNGPAWQEEELRKLGHEPVAPPLPTLLVEDFTPEGVRHALANGLPTLGLFSDEAARVVGGHAMLPENLLKTCGMLSNLWDGRGGVTARGGDGLIPLYHKRVSLHLMMQPSVAPLLFANPDAQGQGFLWRCLPAWPKPMSGTRHYVERNIRKEKPYLDYYERLLKILCAPLPTGVSTRELQPRKLPLAPGAKRLYVQFFNEIEAGRCPDGEWCNVASFAARIAEHALRIAGVLALVRGLHAPYILESEMEMAISLARWYLREGLRIVECGLDDADLVLAERLLEWMRGREQPVKLADIYQRGPRPIRTADAARRIVTILHQHGYVQRDPGAAEAWRLIG